MDSVLRKCLQREKDPPVAPAVKTEKIELVPGDGNRTINI